MNFFTRYKLFEIQLTPAMQIQTTEQTFRSI